MRVRPETLMTEIDQSGIPGVGKFAMPVVVVGDVNDSPYSRLAIPSGQSEEVNIVAGKQALIFIQPGPSVIYRVTHLLLRNDDAIYHRRMTLRAGTRRQINGTSTAYVEVQQLPMIMLGGPQILAGLSSSVHCGTIDYGNEPGQSFSHVWVPPSQTLEVTMPRAGVSLYGNDPDGTGCLMVCACDSDVKIGATFYGEEYAIPAS